ncbi:MAG: hypothetical protein HN919_07665 [Verrucomicrobia bacterium]|jgi:ribonuclease J|nr:hypothetical protein [Verrucomicrobiota bacterium]
MLFRPSMRIDLEKAACLTGATLVYSMCAGYLETESTKRFLPWLDKHNIPLHQIHTSGHASTQDLQRLRQAFPAATLVPIHTPAPALYKQLFGNVQLHEDGEWWEINKENGP